MIQSGDKTLNNSIPRKWSALALGGFLFTSIFALSPSPVEAECQRDFSGEWTIHQDSYSIPVSLSQNGKTVSGTASQSHKNDPVIKGRVTGTVEGSSISVEVNWENGAVGVYNGRIDQFDMLFGTTQDKNNPRSVANWVAEHHFKCVEAAPFKPKPGFKDWSKAEAAPVTPKPIRSSGKALHEGATPAVPRIIAYNKPGQTPGTQTLSWDGGPDHPYAEVWVKVNDEDAKFVVEKGKGTREVTVQPGNTYLYILSDSNQQLATVTVK